MANKLFKKKLSAGLGKTTNVDRKIFFYFIVDTVLKFLRYPPWMKKHSCFIC